MCPGTHTSLTGQCTCLQVRTSVPAADIAALRALAYPAAPGNMDSSAEASDAAHTFVSQADILGLPKEWAPDPNASEPAAQAGVVAGLAARLCGATLAEPSANV